MAQIIGDLGPDATYGEQRVLELLSGLSDDYTVWPELPINADYVTYPDFTVLHPRIGVCVLEVKDWVEIVTANPSTFRVRTREGKDREEKNPLTGAHVKATKIAGKLQLDQRLVHSDGPHRGKLKLPWGVAVVFPNLSRMFVHGLGEVLNPQQMICMDDLETGQLEQRLLQMAYFPVDLAPAELDVVRSVLFPELRLSQALGGEAVLDLEQERIAKGGLYEVQELPPEGQRVAVDPLVRLVRGVAGSGKTLVLSMRAKYLAETHPDWTILVVTFNRPLAQDLQKRLGKYEKQIQVANFHKLCRAWLDEAGLWRPPIEDQEGRIANIVANKTPEIDKFDAEFLCDEFNWMKDTGVLDRDAYLEEPRIGRRKGLAKSDRALVHRVFEHYQSHLQAFRCSDWADVPHMVIRGLDERLLSPDMYDAILVDEAQDFAPVWFAVLRRVLNPETGVMFMAADAAQRIYRKFMWRSLGLYVVGRTRILRRSYRSTYEIARTAFELVSGSQALLDELADEEEDLLQPNLDPAWMRHGNYPQLRRCGDVQAEVSLIARTIKALLDKGYAPGDIAVLHRRHWGPDRYLSALRAEGIPVAHLRNTGRVPRDAVALGTLHVAKGLEYPVVFIGQLQCLFDPEKPIPQAEWTLFCADELRLLYVGMTRARDRLYLTYQSQLPKELVGVKRFLDGVHPGTASASIRGRAN
ncbi:MAG TPA: 3'-5' exonuclease [Anaerolineae bacterium]|nr:3'-5' exonuclease [Anaerolineae bacterium]